MKIKDLLEKNNITIKMLLDKDCIFCFMNDLAIENGFADPFRYNLQNDHFAHDFCLKDLDYELKPIRKKGEIPHPL